MINFDIVYLLVGLFIGFVTTYFTCLNLQNKNINAAFEVVREETQQKVATAKAIHAQQMKLSRAKFNASQLESAHVITSLNEKLSEAEKRDETRKEIIIELGNDIDEHIELHSNQRAEISRLSREELHERYAHKTTIKQRDWILKNLSALEKLAAAQSA